MAVSVLVAVAALNVRRIIGTGAKAVKLPAVVPGVGELEGAAGSATESTGAIVTVTAALVRLRTRTVMNEPVRPKESPSEAEGVISTGA